MTTPLEPTFRVAGEPDTDTILTFMPLLYAQDGLSFDEAKARATLTGVLRDRSLGRVWMIHAGAQPIGYMILTLGYSLEYRGRDAFVDELFLLESHRGRGIGRKAMQVLEQACRELDVRALHLEVERPNVAAQTLYRKLGFVDHERYLMTKAIRD